MFGISQKQWKSVLASNLELHDEEPQNQENEQETNNKNDDAIIAPETETLISEKARQGSEETANVTECDGLVPPVDPGVSVSALLEATERSDLSDVQRKLLDQIDKDRETILAQPVKVPPHKVREKELSKR